MSAPEIPFTTAELTVKNTDEEEWAAWQAAYAAAARRRLFGDRMILSMGWVSCGNSPAGAVDRLGVDIVERRWFGESWKDIAEQRGVPVHVVMGWAAEARLRHLGLNFHHYGVVRSTTRRLVADLRWVIRTSIWWLVALVSRVGRQIDRWRVSAADRAEFDDLDRAILLDRLELENRVANNKARARSKFQPELVRTVPERYIQWLGDFTVPELITEIAMLKDWLAIQHRGVNTFAALELHFGQLSALQAEFDERDYTDRTGTWRCDHAERWWMQFTRLSRMDRKRVDAARSMVHDGSEFIPF